MLSMYSPARNACVTGDLTAAEDLLTQRINAIPNNYIYYASRSCVMTRMHHWDRALDDALKVR